MDIRTIALGLSLALCGASVADAQTRTGFHIGIQGGMSMANTELSVGPLGIDGLGAEGMVAGVHVGADYQIPGSAVVVGAFADYSWQDVEFSVSPNLFSASLKETYTLGARAGVVVGNAMPYLLAGYTSAETGAEFLGVAIADTPTLTGWTFGGGIEFDVAPSIVLAGEYRHTKFDTENIGGVVNLDTDQSTFLARLSYRFGGDEAAKPARLK